ncbi:hypothetical protein [Arenicella xantha]|uniref:Uncharacterized protein n=1 Tax=Arenicella xantha TaxID=644221 RepID=A0A395JGK9_9GAMM|nr:hypothetical protein [Arenicella xantha]RBP48922.1 hypothetical protein DFR28_105261 [Arenicella xantha]
MKYSIKNLCQIAALAAGLFGLTTQASAMPSFLILSPLIESNEQNNLDGETLDVSVGDALRISWIVENSAPTDGSTSFTHYISDNTFISRFDIPLGTSSVSNSLAFTSIDKITAIADVTPGIYYIGTCEGQEGDCEIAGSVNVVPEPSILLLSPLISAAGKDNLNGETVKVRIERKLTISWISENSSPAPGVTAYTHYLSTDNVITAMDTIIGDAEIDNTLELAGITSEVVMPDLPLGLYKVITCENIDDACEIAGTIELLEAFDMVTAPLLLLLD